MTRQSYRAALGVAAHALRVERGYRSVAALAREGRITESAARRIEGKKEPEKDHFLASVEEYAAAIGVTMSALFTRADELYYKDQRSAAPTGPPTAEIGPSSDATPEQRRA